MPSTKWTGRRLMAARAAVAATLPAPCGQCGKTVHPTDAWVIGHKIPRVLRPDLTWEPTNWQVEHRACSDRTGAAVAKQKRELAILPTAAPGNPAPFPSSLSPAQRAGDCPTNGVTGPTR